METFDVVIVGAGTAGETLAETLAKKGGSVALVEANRVGGECPFVACMPSKALLRSAHVRQLFPVLPDLGAASRPYQPDDDRAAYELAVRRRDRIVEDRDDAEHARGVEDVGVTLVRGWGRVARPGVVAVGARELGYHDLVITTGSQPVRPPISGLDAVPTWSSDEAMSSYDYPESLAIMGGGAVGCEFAQLFAGFGCRVTLLETTPRLLPANSAEMGALLADVLRGSGIDVRLGARVERAEADPRGARLTLDDGAAVTVARVVVAVGRKATVEGLGLEILGIQASKNGLDIDASGRVEGQPHVWAAGDVTGDARYTHAANVEARLLATNLLGGAATLDLHAIPRVMYVEPECASVGLATVRAAQAAGHDAIGAAVDLRQTERAVTDGTRIGRLELVADRERRVLLGAAIIGPHASEWIGEATLAVQAGIPLDTLARVVHPFPTFSSVYELALGQLIEAVS